MAEAVWRFVLGAICTWAKAASSTPQHFSPAAPFTKLRCAALRCNSALASRIAFWTRNALFWLQVCTHAAHGIHSLLLTHLFVHLTFAEAVLPLRSHCIASASTSPPPAPAPAPRHFTSHPPYPPRPLSHLQHGRVLCNVWLLALTATPQSGNVSRPAHPISFALSPASPAPIVHCIPRPPCCSLLLPLPLCLLDPRSFALGVQPLTFFIPLDSTRPNFHSSVPSSSRLLAFVGAFLCCGLQIFGSATEKDEQSVHRTIHPH